MPLCGSCGESIPPGMELCPMCGNAFSAQASPNAYLEAEPADDIIEGIPIAENRQCSVCQKSYDAMYPDTFCTCGGELIETPTLTAQPLDESLEPTLTAEAVDEPTPLPTLTAQSIDDASGVPLLTAELIDDEHDAPTLTAQTVEESLEETQTEHRLGATVEDAPTELRRLVLYGEDKQPIADFPISKDVTLIGRLDAVEGVFPDIDIRDWVGADVARRVSRKHALILRSRKDNVVRLRALPGNTGTQLDGDMIQPMTDHELTPGRRIILGGAVRLKFEERE